MLIREFANDNSRDAETLAAISKLLSGRAQDRAAKKQISTDAFIELARSMGINVTPDNLGEMIAKPPLSNLLEPLLSSGLINREQDAQDRRAFRLYVSLKGKRLLAKAPKPTRGILPDTLMHLDSNSLASVDQALALLVERLSSARARHALEPLPFTL